MRLFKKLSMKKNMWAIISNAAFPLFFFFYFQFRIDAKLIYQSQQPVFFFDAPFIREFFTYAGGINELLASFLAQFFYYSWSGALVLTLLLSLVAWITRNLFRTLVNFRSMLFAHWLPSLGLFILFHEYDFPLTVTLGFLLAGLTTFLFIRFAPTQPILRGLFFLLFYTALYFITAGPVLLFVVLAVLFDLLVKKFKILPLVYVFIAGVTPFLGAEFLFILLLKKSYLLHLGLDVITPWPWMIYLLWAFLPTSFILLSFVEKPAQQKIEKSTWMKKLFSERSAAVLSAQFAILFLFVGLICWKFFQPKEKALLALDYYARQQQWQKVIKAVQDGALLNTYIGQYQLNRALFHTGRLCESMFVFPQQLRMHGLFLHESVRHLFPLQYSDLFYDLGLINEAQHWAHEALSVTGDTPWNLQRLALANIIKKEYPVALKCLGRLEKTLWFKTWAKKLVTAIERQDFSAYPELTHLAAMAPTIDFIVIPAQPEACLEELLKANAANKMAYEYYMAGLLLDGKVGRFINHLDGLPAMNYTKIPRHFEEAILLYMMNTGRRDFLPPDAVISAGTVRAFQDYIAVVKKYNNPTLAYREIAAKYSDTYWFYASYIYKKDS